MARKVLLKSLQRSDRWERLITIENESLKFITVGVNEYSQDEIQFQELILLCCAAGLTGWGTEMLSLLYKNNMTVARNIMDRW